MLDQTFGDLDTVRLEAEGIPYRIWIDGAKCAQIIALKHNSLERCNSLRSAFEIMKIANIQIFYEVPIRRTNSWQ